MTDRTIVWFRQDLRLADNPALHAAAERGTVVPVYIWCPDEEGDWAAGAASRVWLHRSLEAFATSLETRGVGLILRMGPALEALEKLAEETGATAVYWNRRYEPAIVRRDKRVKAALSKAGLDVKSFNAGLLFEPWTLETKQGDPYKVFTPFWKSCLDRPEPREPIPAPNAIRAPRSRPESETLDALSLRPDMDWDTGIRDFWTPGEAGARDRFDAFLDEGVAEYADRRDLPGEDCTSRLSPHLHFGEIGPHTIWHATRHSPGPTGKGREAFLREIGWREFSYHLLYHFPATPNRPLRPEFENFPWEYDETRLDAWRHGRSGYPIVDAGMRQLWEIGWMHNRVRMLVASFLVKDLRMNWSHGARWFWDTLVDADLANNTQGWQWAAGCGADAAPYFRVFNPVLQSKKFDPDGRYIREWAPELAGLPNAYIHAPWEAPEDVLAEAGVRLGETYPAPLVDHAQARAQALELFEAIKKA